MQTRQRNFSNQDMQKGQQKSHVAWGNRRQSQTERQSQTDRQSQTERRRHRSSELRPQATLPSNWNMDCPKPPPMRADRFPVRHQLYKSKVCAFFRDGKCTKGDQCSHAHSLDELRRPPDLSRTSLCKQFRFYGSCDVKNCRFAHSRDELNITNLFFHSKMCAFSKTGCRSGSHCRFAHSDEELRSGIRKSSIDSNASLRTASPKDSTVGLVRRPMDLRMMQQGAMIPVLISPQYFNYAGDTMYLPQFYSMHP